MVMAPVAPLQTFTAVTCENTREQKKTGDWHSLEPMSACRGVGIMPSSIMFIIALVVFSMF